MNRDHEQTDDQPDITELMEACRPGPEDLRLPEMEALAAALQSDSNLRKRWQKSQQLDGAIGQAMREVPVPPALGARLRAVLDIAEKSTIVPTAALTSEPISPADPTAASDPGVILNTVLRPGVTPSDGSRSRPAPHSRWTLRRVVSLSAAAIVVAMVVGIAATRKPDPSFSSQSDVAVSAETWLGVLRGPAWRRSDMPTADFPLPQVAGLQNPYRWQSVSRPGSTVSVVCYEVSATTYLFACRGADAAGLLGRPPSTPTQLASEWLVGGWQSEGLVYVLAVRGNPAEYHQRVQSHRTIAGWLSPTGMRRVAC